MLITIDDILKATDGELIQAGTSPRCAGVSIDSRTMKEGDVFFAIKGLHYDGHKFIGDAVKNGAKTIVVGGQSEVPNEIAVIKTDDTELALGRLASWWRQKFSVPCVAITGSNGKSTTKEMIAAIVSSFGDVLKTEGNFNNLIGLPLTVFRWREEHKVAVLEMGMNAPGEISRLTGIARPDVGLITNVTSAHLEKLHSVERVADAKEEMFQAMSDKSIAVVNDEDPLVRAMGDRFKGEVVSFGMQNSSTVRFMHMVSESLDSTELTLRIGGEERTLHMPIPGAHNVMNALAAFAVGYALKLDVDTMVEGFSDFKPMAMRFECVQLTNGVRLVNDSYNANPQSMQAAFRTVSAARRAGRFIAILGDMYELGKQSSQLHQQVGEAAAKWGVSKLFVVGDHADDVARGAARGGLNNSSVSVVEEVDSIGDMMMKEMKVGDVILIKGSRAMRMERIAEYLKREIGTG